MKSLFLAARIWGAAPHLKHYFRSIEFGEPVREVCHKRSSSNRGSLSDHLGRVSVLVFDFWGRWSVVSVPMVFRYLCCARIPFLIGMEG